MSAKNMDKHNRWRSRQVAFRLSPEEAEAVVKAVAELIFPFLREEADD